MSPPPSRPATESVVPRGLQAGANAGSPPLGPLSPIPSALPVLPGQGAPTATAAQAQWQFGTIPPFPALGGVTPARVEDHEMAEAVVPPSDEVGMPPELAALHALNARLEADNAALREQVRARDRSLKRYKAMRSSLAGRLNEVEADARGLRQERGALGDALSLMEDERDELAVRVRDLQARGDKLEGELAELRITVKGRTREVYWERELNRFVDGENAHLRQALETARKDKEAESSLFVRKMRSLVAEIRERVPRPLYERSFRQAQSAIAGSSRGAGPSRDPPSAPPSSPPLGSPVGSEPPVEGTRGLVDDDAIDVGGVDSLDGGGDDLEVGIEDGFESAVEGSIAD